MKPDPFDSPDITLSPSSELPPDLPGLIPADFDIQTEENVNPGPILTAEDLPTLRRLVAHCTERARHRRFLGRVACYTLARICADAADGIERHGAVHPAVNYRADVISKKEN